MKQILNADKPIKNVDEDLLGREYFAKKFANAIGDMKSKDGLVIGVYGKWGSGKTSLVNMALKELETTSDNVVVKFLPWNYSSADILIPEFFSCLEAEINGKHKDISKTIGKALINYKETFLLLKPVPKVGGILAKAGMLLSDNLGRYLSREHTVADRKEKLETALLGLDKRIIVVIDDIDRLDKACIRNIFQLVKQVADFSNITYILLMDDEVVSKALEDVQTGNGYDYIEKIVQVPISVPEIFNQKLSEILFNKLNVEVGVGNEVDSRYWQFIYSNCVEHCINNLRDINRLINISSFKINLLKNEICIEDIIALSAIEMKEPELYKWIINNMYSLCGGGMHYADTYGMKPDDIRKRYEDQLQRITSDVKWAMTCVAALFPSFATHIGEYTSSGGLYDESELRAFNRISARDKLELYLGMDVQALPISRNTMIRIVKDLDENKIKEIIEQLINEQGIGYFLDELKAIDSEIPDERTEMFMDIMLSFKTRLWVDTGNLFSRGRDSYRAKSIFDDLYIRLSETERSNYLCDRMAKADEAKLEAIGEKVIELLEAYGKIGENPKDNTMKQLVSIVDLPIVENNFYERIKVLAKNKAIHLENDISTIEFYWRNKDKQDYENYLKILFAEDKIAKLKYVAKRAGTWANTKESGYTYRHSDIGNYVSMEDIEDTINSLDKSILINDFTDTQLIKLATLILEEFYSKGEVSSDEAKKMVEEWKNSR